MDLASVQIVETPEDTAAAEAAETDMQSVEAPAREGTAASGFSQGADQLLFGISRTGREPVINRAKPQLDETQHTA